MMDDGEENLHKFENKGKVLNCLPLHMVSQL